MQDISLEHSKHMDYHTKADVLLYFFLSSDLVIRVVTLDMGDWD